MLPLFFSEGKFIDSLPLTDRSIHYGDGLFETVAISNNKPELLRLHLSRLKQASHALGIPHIGDNTLTAQINSLLKQKPQKKAVLKIIVTRGSGGRGYAPPKNITPRCIFGLYDYPNDTESFREKGINVFLCKTKLAYNSPIAGIKHLNRLEQVLAAHELDSMLYQEGFMFDSNDSLVEGIKTNIFVVKNNDLFTPKLDQFGIYGIMRQFIVSLARELKLNVFEAQLSIDDLKAADEVFVCNSIIKIWPVIAIEKQQYRIGCLTQKLIDAVINKISNENIK